MNTPAPVRHPCCYPEGFGSGRLSTLKGQLPLATKFFRNTDQVHKGYASRFVKPFSSRLLQISKMFNWRFEVQRRHDTRTRLKVRTEPMESLRAGTTFVRQNDFRAILSQFNHPNTVVRASTRCLRET